MDRLYDILLKNAAYLTADMTISHASIALSEGRIAAVLPADADVSAKQVVENRPLLWMPGLVGGHTHTSPQLLRGRKGGALEAGERAL